MIFAGARAGKSEEGPVQETADALRRIGQLEGAMAELYDACAALDPGDAALWRELEQEERRHVEQVGQLAAIIAARPANFQRHRPLSPAAVQTMIAYVEGVTARVRRGGFAPSDGRQLLALARDMEQSIIESKYTEIVRTTDLEYERLVRSIVAETVSHKQRIASRLGARP
jgi:hypothetical protein